MTCPNHASFCILTIARRGSCVHTRKLILLRTLSLSTFFQNCKRSRTMLPSSVAEPPDLPWSILCFTLFTGFLLSRESSTNSLLCFQIVSDQVPVYLLDLLHLYTSSCWVCFFCRQTNHPLYKLLWSALSPFPGSWHTDTHSLPPLSLSPRCMCVYGVGMGVLLL